MLRSGLLIALTTLTVGGVITGSGSTGARAQSASSSPHVGEALRPSSPEQLALSKHLRQQGAVLYGAWWCPHCFAQKNLFGKEAGDQLPYVECDKSDEGRQRCVNANVRAFPTWELNGERLEGVQSLEKLKQWSGYSAAR